MRNLILRTASVNPKLRRKMIAKLASEILSMEFPTKDSLRKYMEKHPGANPRNHSVVKKPKKRDLSNASLSQEDVSSVIDVLTMVARGDEVPAKMQEKVLKASKMGLIEIKGWGLSITRKGRGVLSRFWLKGKETK